MGLGLGEIAEPSVRVRIADPTAKCSHKLRPDFARMVQPDATDTGYKFIKRPDSMRGIPIRSEICIYDQRYVQFSSGGHVFNH